MGYNEPLHHNPSGEPPATHRRYFAAMSSPPIVLAFAAADPTRGARGHGALPPPSGVGSQPPDPAHPLPAQATRGRAHPPAAGPRSAAAHARLRPPDHPAT